MLIMETTMSNSRRLNACLRFATRNQNNRVLRRSKAGSFRHSMEFLGGIYLSISPIVQPVGGLGSVRLKAHLRGNARRCRREQTRSIPRGDSAYARFSGLGSSWRRQMIRALSMSYGDISILTLSPTVKRTQRLRILPEIVANTRCLLSNSTRNIVPGRTV